MMTGVMRELLLWGLSILEIGVCYRILYIGWLDREERSRLERVVFAVTILIGAALVTKERYDSLFSYRIILVQVLFTCLSLCVVQKKGKFTGITLVCGYFTATALLNFMLAFLMMNTMQNQPLPMVEILVCSDALVLGVSSQMKRDEERLREVIAKYRGNLLLFAFEGLIVLGIYHVMNREFNSGELAQAASAAVVLVMMIVLFFLVFQLYLWKEKTAGELKFAEDKEKLLEDNYQQLSQMMQENRENIHDMKHHIRTLQELADNNEIEKIQGYLNELGESVFKGDQMLWTESRILNTILNKKKEEAENKGILVEIQSDLAFQLPFTDRELCAVFCNLLDNAIEACETVEEGKRWIEVSLRKQGEMAFVIIGNSIARKPDIKNGFPVSHKPDENIHGLGLKSVNRNVKRHVGDLQFEIGEKIFRIYLSFFAV